MSSILQDELHIPNMIIVGVFGYNNTISETDIQENIIRLLLQEWGRIPDKLLLPSEGYSSIYLQEWAETLHIKMQIFQSDWVRNGKSAQRIRESRMEKECTHALVFLSKRTNRLEKYAELLAKKGKIVFTSCHNQILTQLDYEPPMQASKPAHKSNKERGQMLLKFQKKEQCLELH
jgi:hypothetical protein